MSESNELANIAEQNNLPNNKVQELLSQFGESFNAAKAVAEEAKGISVTDENQKEQITNARTTRLKLKNIRVEVEKNSEGS
jgi:hypothetical protein